MINLCRMTWKYNEGDIRGIAITAGAPAKLSIQIQVQIQN